MKRNRRTRMSQGFVKIVNAQITANMQKQLSQFQIVRPVHKQERSLSKQKIIDILIKTVPSICARNILLHEKHQTSHQNDKNSKSKLSSFSSFHKKQSFSQNKNFSKKNYDQIMSIDRQSQNQLEILEKVKKMKENSKNILQKIDCNKERRQTLLIEKIKKEHTNKFQKVWNSQVSLIDKKKSEMNRRMNRNSMTSNSKKLCLDNFD